MSANNDVSTLRNITEERIPHLHCGGNLEITRGRIHVCGCCCKGNCNCQVQMALINIIRPYPADTKHSLLLQVLFTVIYIDKCGNVVQVFETGMCISENG